ncbi:MAG: PEP-CTERM system histidine kinase PrsK [Gammaproteobacteria bacterium]|nr:PEP-CTERM system histidine kinase PrsK [Gammaproteobacteria bacterium]
MNLGAYGYIGAGIAYGLFAALLISSWRSSLQGKMLTVVSVISAAWAFVATEIARGEGKELLYQGVEIIRYIAWYIFLLKLFDASAHEHNGYQKFLKWALPTSLGFAGMLLAGEIFYIAPLSILSIVGHVMLALIGLAIIEQLYRNAVARHLWAIKYLFVGAGGIFAYDFYMYADALLFRGVDHELWSARGVIHFVAVPLIAISAVRSKSWSLNIFVSRDIVLNSTAIFAGGIYLLLMSGAGYYLREFGGTWGRVAQVLFFALAVVLLVTVMLSSQLRARIKVFLAKHFYKNKYDYRVEWLRLTEKLDQNRHSQDRYKVTIEALAQIVDGRAGSLWICEESGNYINVAAWQVKQIEEVESGKGNLVSYFIDRGFIINISELDLRPDEYKGLRLPEWLIKIERPWLIVPLQGSDSVIGFIVLAKPLVNRAINWEDRDLLNAAAKQVASYLTALMTSEALTQAKQFEVFSRLSAYMVHDLKNIASELEMVSRNSKKHMSNPEFIEDAFDTVDNAAVDINRLLDQLRNKRTQAEKKSVIDLVGMLRDVIDKKMEHSPQPRLEISEEVYCVVAEKNRLSNVLAHLIDNAQQATEDDGSIDIRIFTDENMHVIEIKDTGHGMDDNFIRERLFKPFDTTKGNAGMGIGMHESRELIRELGGDIRVQSKVGAGSTISLYIPVSTEQDIM